METKTWSHTQGINSFVQDQGCHGHTSVLYRRDMSKCDQSDCTIYYKHHLFLVDQLVKGTV